MAALAKLAAAALAAFGENAAESRLRPLLAVELMKAAPVVKRADERLGEAGCAALRIARGAAPAMEERGCARGIVDALMLARLGDGGGTLSLGELRLRLPERYQPRGPTSGAGAAVTAPLQALADRTGGVITFDGREARFNPRAAGAPEVAAFNRALPLLQLFDATLSEAAELADVRARLRRASDAMARAVEAARRVGAALEEAYRELRTELSLEHRQTIDDFIALAEAGPAALIQLPPTSDRARIRNARLRPTKRLPPRRRRRPGCARCAKICGPPR